MRFRRFSFLDTPLSHSPIDDAQLATVAIVIENHTTPLRNALILQREKNKVHNTRARIVRCANALDF
jgi:hypothetical protein